MTCGRYYLVKNQKIDGCTVPFKVFYPNMVHRPNVVVPKTPWFGAPIIRLSPYIRQNYPVKISVNSANISFNIFIPHNVSRYIVSEIYRQKALGVTGDVIYHITLPQYKVITYGSYESLANLLKNIKQQGPTYPLFEDKSGNTLKLDNLIEKTNSL